MAAQRVFSQRIFPLRPLPGNAGSSRGVARLWRDAQGVLCRISLQGTPPSEPSAYLIGPEGSVEAVGWGEGGTCRGKLKEARGAALLSGGTVIAMGGAELSRREAEAALLNIRLCEGRRQSNADTSSSNASKASNACADTADTAHSGNSQNSPARDEQRVKISKNAPQADLPTNGLPTPKKPDVPQGCTATKATCGEVASSMAHPQPQSEALKGILARSNALFAPPEGNYENGEPFVPRPFTGGGEIPTAPNSPAIPPANTAKAPAAQRRRHSRCNCVRRR